MKTADLSKFWKIYKAIRRAMHRRELRALDGWRGRMILQIEARGADGTTNYRRGRRNFGRGWLRAFYPRATESGAAGPAAGRHAGAALRVLILAVLIVGLVVLAAAAMAGIFRHR